MSDAIKPMTPEEEYFARENAEKMRKLAAEQAARLAAEEKEALKKLHWMHCPKCGMNMHSIQFRGQTIEKCPTCGGVYLDDGELEKIAAAYDEHGVVTTLMGIFSGKKK